MPCLRSADKIIANWSTMCSMNISRCWARRKFKRSLFREVIKSVRSMLHGSWAKWGCAAFGWQQRRNIWSCVSRRERKISCSNNLLLISQIKGGSAMLAALNSKITISMSAWSLIFSHAKWSHIRFQRRTVPNSSRPRLRWLMRSEILQPDLFFIVIAARNIHLIGSNSFYMS